MVKVKGKTEDYFIVAELRVPHLERTATFVSSSFGPDTYQEIGKAILKAGLKLPTDENASLVHASYCGPKEFRETNTVKEILRKRWLWTFRNRLWVPEGVYSVRDLKVEGIARKLIVGELEDILKNGNEITENGVRESKDGGVRFAPKTSYELGENSPEEFAKQGDVVADYGVDGTKKLAEASTKLRYKPRTWGVEVKEGQKPVKRVSALGSCWNGEKLDLDGDDFGDFGLGSAFGVRS